MASCAITISGTSGYVNIRYKLGSVQHEFDAYVGEPVYIDTTATSVTYTTMSGDATATSGCVTITSLIKRYYILHWETVPQLNFDLDAFYDMILLDSEEISIDNVDFVGTHWSDVATSIAQALDSRYVVTAGKQTNSSRGSVNMYLVVRVLGTKTPYLRINNNSQSHKLFVKGELTTSSVPSGYEVFDSCFDGTTTTTTTTSSTTTTTTVSS